MGAPIREVPHGRDGTGSPAWARRYGKSRLGASIQEVPLGRDDTEIPFETGASIQEVPLGPVDTGRGTERGAGVPARACRRRWASSRVTRQPASPGRTFVHRPATGSAPA
jgi:hypothetical protein